MIPEKRQTDIETLRAFPADFRAAVVSLADEQLLTTPGENDNA